jgi:NhaA family Na+:H+ antiporter
MAVARRAWGPEARRDDVIPGATVNKRPEKLDPPIDLDRDHVLGPPDAEMTLVEYGS